MSSALSVTLLRVQQDVRRLRHTEHLRSRHMNTTTAELLAPRDAGKLLGITTAGVRGLAERGRLREIRDSAGRRLFRAADVARLAKEREARQRARSR